MTLWYHDCDYDVNQIAYLIVFFFKIFVFAVRVRLLISNGTQHQSHPLNGTPMTILFWLFLVQMIRFFFFYLSLFWGEFSSGFNNLMTQITVWDMSLEEDEETIDAALPEGARDYPPQLLFVHQVYRDLLFCFYTFYLFNFLGVLMTFIRAKLISKNFIFTSKFQELFCLQQQMASIYSTQKIFEFSIIKNELKH